MADSKWKQQEDGTWRRVVNGNEETTAINPNATEGAVSAAAELGVDLNSVKGTGKGGSITKSDVEGAAS